LKTAALIVAGGRGTRASSTLAKQYARIGGTSVLARTLGVFLEYPGIDLVQVVIGPGDAEHYAVAVEGIGGNKLLPSVHGAPTRQASVQHGLQALKAHAPDRVLIHDAVRPFVTADVITRVIEALAHSPGAIAAVPSADTLKRAGPDQRVAAGHEFRP
jgi:2-C-methyl-D-erythritol 4-phosphate cytidylyltransferase/2-C-methyl-D-erythritol 2,4-cyclodiphosphate synthase